MQYKLNSQIDRLSLSENIVYGNVCRNNLNLCSDTKFVHLSNSTIRHTYDQAKQHYYFRGHLFEKHSGNN